MGHFSNLFRNLVNSPLICPRAKLLASLNLLKKRLNNVVVTLFPWPVFVPQALFSILLEYVGDLLLMGSAGLKMIDKLSR